MPYYTLVDRPRPLPDSPRTIVCTCCGDTMNHLRTLPKYGIRAEKLIFVCPSCKGVDAKERVRTPQAAASKTPNHPTIHSPSRPANVLFDRRTGNNRLSSPHRPQADAQPKKIT
jgi:hypothetical protein